MKGSGDVARALRSQFLLFPAYLMDAGDERVSWGSRW